MGYALQAEFGDFTEKVSYTFVFGNRVLKSFLTLSYRYQEEF